MDPLTHALLGAAVAQAAFGRRLGRRAALIGAAAALFPDADVLIRSSADPLLAIEHHRGFTHALAFVPIGGTVAALPWLRRGRRAPSRQVLGAALAGYATHPLLDASTTYGTQLFWPFSRYRVGLDAISILDPLFTLILLAGLGLALHWRTAVPAVAALVCCLLYLGLGLVQRERALAAQDRIAQARGQLRERGAVFPTLGNSLVWRSLYEAGDSLYTDRLRVPWFGAAQWTPGSAIARLRAGDLPPAERADARVRRDFERFAWFCDGWVARAPAEPEIIGDVRYSLATGTFEPVWGIRFERDGPGFTTTWVNRSRERRPGLTALWQELTGRDAAFRPVPVLAAPGTRGARLTGD